jgi:hypothetical protein
MKTIILMIVLMFAAIVVAEPLDTVQYTGFLVKSSDSNDTALAPNTSSWAVCKLWPKIPEYANGIKIKFYIYEPNDPNNLTFSYQLYVADHGGNAQIVGYGDATVGGSKISHNPISLKTLNSGAIDPNYAWVDTLGTITTDWAGGITAQNDGGLNGESSFIFDKQSGRHIWCRIYGRSSAYMKVYCIAFGY